MAKFYIKAKPGKYGKDHIKLTADNLVEIDPETKIPSGLISTPNQIFHRKKRNIFTHNLLLNVLFGFCAIVLILLKFILNDIFTTVEGENFEEILSRLSFAFIASYIFYIIVVRRNEKIRKRETYAVTCGLTASLIHHGQEVKKWIKTGALEDIDLKRIESLKKEDFKKICAKVDIRNLDTNGVSVGEKIIFHGVKTVKSYSEKIFNYMPFLDGELISLLNKINNCQFSRTIVLLPYKTKNHLEEYSDDIFEFLTLIDELEKYNNKLINKYLKGYELKY